MWGVILLRGNQFKKRVIKTIGEYEDMGEEIDAACTCGSDKRKAEEYLDHMKQKPV